MSRMASDASASGSMVLRAWLEEAVVPELRIRITYGYGSDAVSTVTRVVCTAEDALEVVRAWLAGLDGARTAQRPVPMVTELLDGRETAH